jgi:hypothetical protein
VFEAKRAEEQAAGGGWTADTTRLVDYLRQAGRPVPAAETEAGPMFQTISLVSAIKR